MRRGDVVVVAERGAFTGKPRPAVIVQNDAVPADHSTVVVCLITSAVAGVESVRVHVQPTRTNRLRKPSAVLTDQPTTIRRARCRPTGGQLSATTMRRVDDALRLWLAV